MGSTTMQAVHLRERIRFSLVSAVRQESRGNTGSDFFRMGEDSFREQQAGLIAIPSIAGIVALRS